MTDWAAQGAGAVVVKAGAAFRIGGAHLAEFLEHSPALMLALSGAQLVA